MTSFGCVPLASVCPCARCVEAITSPSSSARQTPDGAGLLADRDVQEPGQLARAEALLDLLLEAPDQEHLAEELAQELLRDGAFLLDLGHYGFEFMLRLVSLVDQWQEILARAAGELGRCAPSADGRGRRTPPRRPRIWGR